MVGMLEACEFASACTQFSACTIRTWAVDVFRDYFAVMSNIDDVTDDSLELELSSSRGKHPKWVSLMSDVTMRMPTKPSTGLTAPSRH